MISYLVKIWVLIIFSALIIFFYYSNGAHIENFDGYVKYFLPIVSIYGMYKFLTIYSFKERVQYTPINIFGFFSLHLLILCTLFFSYNGESFGLAFGNGLNLFFKTLFYSILPVLIILVTTSFGKSILGKLLGSYQQKSSKYRLITGIGFGFFSFIFLLTALGMLGNYNLWSVFGVLLGFLVISYKEFGDIFSGIMNYKLSFKNHNIYSKNILEQINPKLLSTEFLFIVISLILSINLISVVRPFPIGWDDLGAYMNFAHLMANAGYIGELGSMMSWQSFTGIGYMFNNPTQAFFLNNVGGFVSVIVVALIVSEIFKGKKISFINLPLLAATLFISMPMIVFQQAKDMKLDAGLFFISIVALYMLFEFYVNYNKNKDDEKLLSKKEVLKLFFIIGLLLGFTFTIKFTSLLLISAVFGILFYTRLGVLGFLGYLSLYFAIFTAGGLWKMMNVVALDSDELKMNFSIISLIIGIALIITARIKTRKKFRRFIPRIIVLLLGIAIAILPWVIQNISSTLYAGQNIGISKLISGTADGFKTDYNKIYSKEELEKVESESSLVGLSSSGTTTNEDFGRYFGYEKGINNYVKLPWNLTMQNNQGGEFTTIGFLFLALLPTIFLFLPFRRKEYALGVYGLIFFEILLFVIPVTSQFFTGIMSSLSLPYGYIFILLLALLPLIFFIPTLQKKDLVTLFKINLIFAIFYTFLWGISAFGVVWYGIVMYFNLILMIIFGAYYLGSYKKSDTEKKIQLKFFGSMVFFSIICIYLFGSVFPHSFINLQSAGYKDYKVGNITVAEAPYLFHREYLPILYNLNIADDKREAFIDDAITSDQLKKIIYNNKFENNILGIEELLKQIIPDERIESGLRKQADDSLQQLYKNISKPDASYKNTKGIYRIGTFLKYHIIENNKRLYEDSLVIQFDKYFYDDDYSTAIDRMKQIGLNYLLVDLNAATIDKDPRHALTKRYERLLKVFTSSSLELIETDSMCLKIGLEQYKKSKNIDKYLKLAGVNHESYNVEGDSLTRRDKQVSCYQGIVEMFNAGEVTQDSYSYLLPYKEHLKNLQTLEEKIVFLHKYLGHGYKVLFKIK